MVPVEVSVPARQSRITGRALALLDQAFDLINNRRDPAKALAAAYDRDPLAFLERVSKLVTPPPADQGKNTNNINSLFVLAARQAAQLPVLDAVTIEDSSGVQSGYSTSEPIDW